MSVFSGTEGPTKEKLVVDSKSQVLASTAFDLSNITLKKGPSWILGEWKQRLFCVGVYVMLFEQKSATFEEQACVSLISQLKG